MSLVWIVYVLLGIPRPHFLQFSPWKLVQNGNFGMKISRHLSSLNSESYLTQLLHTMYIQTCCYACSNAILKFSLHNNMQGVYILYYSRMSPHELLTRNREKSTMKPKISFQTRQIPVAMGESHERCGQLGIGDSVPQGVGIIT